MDKILIKELRLPARVGVYDFEKKTPQPICFNINIHLDLSKAKKSDNLNDTIDYGNIISIIKKIALSKHHQLLEHLGQSIIEACLKKHPKISQLDVELMKPSIIDHCAGVGVLISHKSKT